MEKFLVKVNDFGLSKVIANSEHYTRTETTVRIFLEFSHLPRHCQSNGVRLRYLNIANILLLLIPGVLAFVYGKKTAFFEKY